MFKIAVPYYDIMGNDGLFPVPPHRGPRYFMSQSSDYPRQQVYVSASPRGGCRTGCSSESVRPHHQAGQGRGCGLMRLCGEDGRHGSSRHVNDTTLATMIDHKLAFVEQKLKENEVAMKKLASEREEMLRQKKCLVEAKERYIKSQEQKRATMEQQRLKVLREQFERRQKAWKEYHEKLVSDQNNEADIVSQPSARLRFIRGMDGKLYQVIEVAQPMNREKEDKKNHVPQKEEVTADNTQKEEVTADNTQKEEVTEDDAQKEEVTTENAQSKQKQRDNKSHLKNASSPSKVAGNVKVYVTTNNTATKSEAPIDHTSKKVVEIESERASKDEDIASKWVFNGSTDLNFFSVLSEVHKNQKQIRVSNNNAKTATENEEDTTQTSNASKEEESTDKKSKHVEQQEVAVVEDVPQDEWEDIGAAAGEDDASSSSQKSPNISDGESWMEPVVDNAEKDQSSAAKDHGKA